MKKKGSFNTNKVVKRDTIVLKNMSHQTKVNREPQILIDYLKKLKKEPPYLFLSEKLSVYNKTPEIKLALINAFTEIINKKKKEWPTLHTDWSYALQIRNIHQNNKGK